MTRSLLFATVMREKRCQNFTRKRDVMEIVGTGGDEVGTFNISTTFCFRCCRCRNSGCKARKTAVFPAEAELPMYLKTLVQKMDLTAEQNETVLKKTDMCFMFAPVYHSSMRYAAPVRKETWRSYRI